jgi:hypothetical protein
MRYRLIGDWMLNEELFDSHMTTHYLVPPLTGPFKAIYSEYVALGFEPLHLGYSCISAAGDLPARIAKVRQDYGPISDNHMAAMIKENCHIGDVCMRAEVFDLDEVTVVAFNDRGVLKKGEFEGRMIGGVVKGRVSEAEVLTELQSDKPMYVWERGLIIALLAWSLWASARDPSDRNWQFALVGSAML